MKIEFIIPTYNRPLHLAGMISSIYAQTNPNWSLHVIIDGPHDEFIEVAAAFKVDSRIRFSSIANGPHKDGGHTPRNYGIQEAKEEWVVMSGDDNHYFPCFVDEFLKVGQDPDVNFIYCDFYNSHIKWDKQEASIELNKIDIGCFATRTKYAKNLRLDTTKINADGMFAVEYAKKYCQAPNYSVKIDKAVYIHN